MKNIQKANKLTEIIKSSVCFYNEVIKELELENNQLNEEIFNIKNDIKIIHSTLQNIRYDYKKNSEIEDVLGNIESLILYIEKEINYEK